MPKRRTEVVAASLLTAWTDADTAMQVVGSSLGVFGPGPLDPTVVLAGETPLRNALFDVLLSLVEGGALELRATDDGHYAFRWRDEIASAGLKPDGSTPIDLAVPSPYLADLRRVQAERDEALARAELAEALAAEREHVLRLTDALSPYEPPAAPKPEARPPAAENVVVKKPRKPATSKATVKTAVPGSEVVYLVPPDAGVDPEIDLVEAERASIDDVATEEPAPPRRWSGYAIDKPGQHLVR